LGKDVPKALKFVPGHLPEPPADEAAEARTEVPEPTEEALQTAASIAAEIEDENLRKLVEKAVALGLSGARPTTISDTLTAARKVPICRAFALSTRGISILAEAAYSAKDITVLEGLDPVRKRPGMYIGSTGSRGLHHLAYEVVANSVDEALAGRCDYLEVTIHPDESMTVKTTARASRST
jgi:hypothetical protein